MNRWRFFFIHMTLFLVILLFTEQIWPDILLLSAQIVFIPTLFHVIVEEKSVFKKIYPYIAIPAYVAVAIIAIFPFAASTFSAIVYGLFTLFIAMYGVSRFMQRGFTNMEEFSIDCGLIFLFVGGLWYIAYYAGIDTGFSPLITWLTAIHFHYSSSIMLIFIGFLGRIGKGKAYTQMTIAMIILPWVMAVGITLSRWIELIGVVLYIITIYTFILYSTRKIYKHIYQRIAIITAFSTVGLTIIFACLYILSNGFGMQIMTIQTMLITHGVMNAGLFGFIGTIGWLIAIPEATYTRPTFPLSPIRKKFFPAEGSHPAAGLVKSFDVYIPPNERSKVNNRIKDFYEYTSTYRLQASIHWARWFLPLAFIYKGFSTLAEQINLPLSKKRVEMTGEVLHVDEGVGGRQDVRAWVRKISGKLVFVALYSKHETVGRTYMNIALPLPLTSMHGLLTCTATPDGMELTSMPKNDATKIAGIYLAIGKQGYFRLPLSETFFVEEIGDKLVATHHMQIVGLHFLTIDYVIEKKEDDK